jgi:hypothetical protein
MPFSPGTQQMLQQYGQNTGLFPPEKKRPRYARTDPQPGPSAAMYAPNAQQNLPAQLLPGVGKPSQNAPPPNALMEDYSGQRPASIAGVAPLMQHPLISSSFFDDNRNY